MIAEYRWLPNSLTKGVTLPPLEFEEANSFCRGYYSRDGKIVICGDDPDTNASTIAHEVMHAIQDYHGRLGHGILRGEELLEWDSYHREIYRFFTSYPWEMEALLFEYKVAKDAVNEYWIKEILSHVI